MNHDAEMMKALNVIAGYINATLRMDKAALEQGPFAGLLVKAEKADIPAEPMTADMRTALVELQAALAKVLDQGQTEKSASEDPFHGLLESQFARRR